MLMNKSMLDLGDKESEDFKKTMELKLAERGMFIGHYNDMEH